MCSISYVVSHVCYAVKFLDNLCDFFEFINESIFEAIHSSEFETKPWSYKTTFDNIGFRVKQNLWNYMCIIFLIYVLEWKKSQRVSHKSLQKEKIIK